MRYLVIFCSLVACGPVWAEAHIGFEAKVEPALASFTRPNAAKTVVRIERFYAGAKARSSGLTPGTQILAIDKVFVQHPNTIHRYCKRKKPGDEVVVTVSRNDRLEKIIVELADGDEMRKGGFLAW
jgi:predicted metalloprotease with PDZ domain